MPLKKDKETLELSFNPFVIPLKSETVQRVIACVIQRERSYLVCQRPLHKRHGGLWEFPGGKVEGGENDAAAARRELREELSLELVGADAPTFELADPDSQFLIAFVPVVASGEPTCLEHVDLRWGSLEQLLELPLAPSDKAFVEYLLRQLAA